MLKENIKTLRRSKGLSQEELAVRLNVVRQTVSKWENGLSVPDSDMLIALSQVFETPVSVLLGEAVDEPKADDLKAIAEKLEIINLQMARRKASRRKLLRWLFIALCAAIAAVFVLLAALDSPYLGWDFSDPETAVMAAHHSRYFLWAARSCSGRPLASLRESATSVFTSRRSRRVSGARASPRSSSVTVTPRASASGSSTAISGRLRPVSLS